MADFKARLALRKVVGLGAPVESIVDHLFPRMSERDRQAMVATFHSAGITMGSDIRKRSFGQLCDQLHLPERVCRVLLDWGLAEHGGPQEVMWYGSQSLSGRQPDAREVPQELDDIAAAAFPSMDNFEKMRKTWVQFAQENMSEDEKADALGALCDPAEAQIIYAFRAVLRLISHILPVSSTLVEVDSFMGTLYMASSGGTDLDWSRVVWILQAKPPGMHYLDAMGRLAMSIKLVFEKQPLRKFAVGVIASADVLDAFIFWAEDQSVVDGKLVPVPRTVTNTMFSLHRAHTGVELLMMFMCAPPARLGFVGLP